MLYKYLFKNKYLHIFVLVSVYCATPLAAGTAAAQYPTKRM
jgi:hypothetical protein